MSTAVENNNATVATGSTSSDTVEAMEIDSGVIDHAAKIKELTDLYNQTLKQMDNIHLGPIGNEQEKEAVLMCDKLEKRIQLHQAALSKLKAPSSGTVAPHHPDNAGLPINPDQVPKLQLKHLKSNFFKNCPTFATIEAFITQFEYFVDFACMNITTDWKRLIPMSFPPEMHNWVKTDSLRKVSSWDEAVKVLSKKFGSSALVFQSKTEVLEMTMQDGETANQYHLRFTNAMAEAGYDKNNVVLADLFFKGFPLDWQRRINRFLAASPVRTVARFAEEAISVYNAEKASIPHGVKRSDESTDNDSKKFKSHKKNYGSKNHQNDKNGKYNNVTNSDDIIDTNH